MVVYLDDIHVTGSSEQEHLDRLRALFDRLITAGIRLKREKCQFCLPRLVYLGHIIDASGTRPDPEKVRAILDCPAPKNPDQLRSFLGMANYYGKFVPNMSTTAALLYALTRNGVPYTWGSMQQSAFDS